MEFRFSNAVAMISALTPELRREAGHMSTIRYKYRFLIRSKKSLAGEHWLMDSFS